MTPPLETFTPAALVRYVVHQQSLNRDELGFLPTLAITEYAERRQILPAVDNGDLAAYALFYDGRNGNPPKRNPGRLHVHQICTAHDTRRIYHATHLINALIERAQQRKFNEIAAWVADDIPANAFWQALGFKHIATRLGGQKRNRLHNLWLLDDFL